MSFLMEDHLHFLPCSNAGLASPSFSWAWHSSALACPLLLLKWLRQAEAELYQSLQDNKSTQLYKFVFIFLCVQDDHLGTPQKVFLLRLTALLHQGTWLRICDCCEDQQHPQPLLELCHHLEPQARIAKLVTTPKNTHPTALSFLFTNMKLSGGRGTNTF